MFLSVQGYQTNRVGVVPADEIKSIYASHPPFNTTVNRLDYAAFTDNEPEANPASVSGYGAGSGANIYIAIEFKAPIFIKALDVQTLKAATLGSWGINYLSSVQVQALVNGVWKTVYTFPANLSSVSTPGPDGKSFSERWPCTVPVGVECSGVRIYNAGGYICASTIRPIMG